MPAADPWLPAAPIPLRHSAVVIEVARFDPGQPEFPTTSLPNLECLEVTRRLGPEPSTARFKYIFNTGGENSPANWEEALSGTIALANTVLIMDRIGVAAQKVDETWEWIFDGHAMSFELYLDGQTEQVIITATGVEARCWDLPIVDSFWRNGEDPWVVDDLLIQEIAHFNPKGVGNCCPSPVWGDLEPETGGDKRFPAFLDPGNLVPEPVEDGDSRPTKLWELHEAARYLIFTSNDTEEFVYSPDGATIDGLLRARIPIEGEVFDPGNFDTFTSEEIEAPDLIAGGKGWPTALHELISPKGFSFIWEISTEGEGDTTTPRTDLKLFYPPLGPLYDVYLQPRNTDLDLDLTNLGEARIARDLTKVVNEWEVYGELNEWEVSFILACGFPSDIADAVPAINLRQWHRAHAAYHGENYFKYRLYILDEAGEGHYLPGSIAQVLNTAPNLDAIFGVPNVLGGEEIPRYQNRRRKPIGDLLSTDSNGVPFRYSLSYSQDYDGVCPGIWDSESETKGTWTPLQGNFHLLEDRVGIYFSGEDPNKWPTGNGDRVLRAVECLARNTLPPPDGRFPKFYLRLTCVVRADERIRAVAAYQLNNVITRRILRYADATDRYKLQTISKHSEFNISTMDRVFRDDQDFADAEAAGLQLATRNGPIEGPLTIPRFTALYKIGDRIRSIDGRNVGFAIDTDAGEAVPTYPTIETITWTFGPDFQRTDITMSDQSTNAIARGYSRRRGVYRRVSSR